MSINQIQGLSTREVNDRQKRFGFNELPSKDRLNIIKVVYGLITEPMIFLLLTTVVIYFILGDKNEAILLLCSFLGIIAIEFYQDNKTEKSLEALKNLSSPICDVIRNGKKVTIPGRELVVGDIILLAEGSRVPADAKLISASSLSVNESLLTGESVPVSKHTKEVQDYRMNSVFSGALVVGGHGIAEVTSIGSDTEVGKIGVSLKSITTGKTLLQNEVGKVIRIVATLAISASIILTLAYWVSRGDLLQGLLAGLTLSIAVLPEEFPIVLTIFLALGAWRLAKNNVLARKSHMIETLGSTTVLCVDKTGTLTENRMQILNVIDANGSMHNGDSEFISEIIKYGVLSSQRNPFDPMEEAILSAGKQLFDKLDVIYEKQEIIKEYPIKTNYLSVVQVWGVGDVIKRVALKGAPEDVFDLCRLSQDKQEELLKQVKKLAEMGLRVIAIGKSPDINTDSVPNNRRDLSYEYLGLVGLADPIRKEAPLAVKVCKDAGVRVVMITGDHQDTAMNIAKKVGLDYTKTITGADFEKLSNSERKKVINNISVFSRVSPSHKLMIVNTFKASGEVVAMTGDGVNDAPALKSAHVGIAMGKRGTDVARESAGIVLMDDNFASIVNGVRLGRRIYDNLQKAMSYIISVHIPIAILSVIPVIFKWPLVLIPAHIVFLEFIIDPSCTIIFENEKESKDIMQRPPRKLSAPIFSRRMVLGSIAKGAFVALIVVIAFKFLLDLGWSEDKARGMTFLILVVANIFLILGISGRQVKDDILHRENIPMLVILAVTSISITLVFCVPFLRQLFHFAPLSLVETEIGILIGAFSIFGIIPIKKLFAKKLYK